jgi:hypothetical protein
MRRAPWLFPLVFLAIGAIYLVGGHMTLAALYVALASGMGLYGLGVQSGNSVMRWFGAAISGFVIVILLWLAFG